MDFVLDFRVVRDGRGKPLVGDVPLPAQLNVPPRLGLRRLALPAVPPAILVRKRIAVETAPAEEHFRLVDGMPVERHLARGEIVRAPAVHRNRIAVPVPLEPRADDKGERFNQPEFLLRERPRRPAVRRAALLRRRPEPEILIRRIAAEAAVLEFAAEEEVALEVPEIRRAVVLRREAEVPDVRLVVAQIRVGAVVVVIRVMRMTL